MDIEEFEEITDDEFYQLEEPQLIFHSALTDNTYWWACYKTNDNKLVKVKRTLNKE